MNIYLYSGNCAALLLLDGYKNKMEAMLNKVIAKISQWMKGKNLKLSSQKTNSQYKGRVLEGLYIVVEGADMMIVHTG